MTLGPMLSIVIVNWKTCEPLRSCLASIEQNPPHTPYEVIVVDNDSNDGSAEMVSSYFSWVKLICPGSNIGYACGNNLGISNASGQFVLTLNPDTVFEDASIESALDSLRENKSFGALSIKLLSKSGETQSSVRGFPTIVNVFAAWVKLDKLFPASILGSYSLPCFDYQSTGPAPQPMGTFLLFRREALETVGDPGRPFDERFPIFFNEVDLLYRMSKAGWPCMYLHSAHVVHLHGASTRQVRKSMIWESHKSLLRYFDKHVKGGLRLALPFVSAVVLVHALIKARGYDPGFRP